MSCIKSQKKIAITPVKYRGIERGVKLILNTFLLSVKITVAEF